MALIRALAAAATAGALLMLFGMMAVGNINAAELGTSGLPYIVKDTLGNTLGDIFLWDVILAITVCCLAVHTATIRLTFSMARDNNLPLGSVLARVSGKSRTPIVPALIVGVLAIAILLVNIKQPQIFLVVTSVAIIMVYIAYLLVTGPLLLKRMRGEWPLKDTGGYFTLGRYGFLVNAIAVAYGALMALNLAWPRNAIYNFAAPFHWYLKWGAFVFIGLIAAVGGVYYLLVQRHKTGVLAEHRAERAVPGD